MNVETFNFVWNDDSITNQQDFMVLLAIAGNTAPSSACALLNLKTIAAKARMSEEAVMLSVWRLIASGKLHANIEVSVVATIPRRVAK